MPSQDQTLFADHEYLSLLSDVDFTPIFILGDHRSGTTLLYKTLTATGCFNFVRAYHVIKYEQILANHLNQTETQAIEELEEQFDSLKIGDRTIDKVSATPNLPEEYGFILSNVAQNQSFITPQNLPIFQQLCQKIQFISDSDLPLLLKNPWDFSQFIYIKQTFPAAKFIFIHRHPLHVINSRLKAMRTILSSWNAYIALISQRYSKVFNNLPLRYLFQLLNSDYFNLGLRRATKQSAKSTSYFLDNIDSFVDTDYHNIRYEDLCQSPQHTIEKILEFLQLEPKIDLDYQGLIQPRSVQLLPEVSRNQARVVQQLQLYMDYHGYDLQGF